MYKLKTDLAIRNNSSSASILPVPRIKKGKKMKVLRKKDVIPESGDGGEIAGGGHNTQRHRRKSELEEPQHQASKSARHALDVLHPRSRSSVGGIGERWCLNWVHRRVAYIHRFIGKKNYTPTASMDSCDPFNGEQFFEMKIGDCINFYDRKPD